MINREYGQWVSPYEKELGQRSSLAASGGYTWFMSNLDQLTLTFALSQLNEGKSKINGVTDQGTGMKKNGQSISMGYMKSDQSWIYSLGLNRAPSQAGMGSNFPITEIISFGVTHVFH